MKNIVFLLLSIVGAVFSTVVETIDIIGNSVESTIQFINSSFDSLTNYLYSTGYDINIYKMEDYDIQISSITGEEKGKILLFNDGEFYMTISDDSLLYSCDFKADDSFVDNARSGKLVYNVITGYLKYDEKNKTYVPDGEYISDYPFACFSAYKGQESPGAGRISNPDIYVSDRYGEGWAKDSEKTLTYEIRQNGPQKNMEGFSQFNLSCYYTNNSNGDPLSEGNCCTVAPFTIIRYLMRKYHRDDNYADSHYEVYNPEIEEPNIYNNKNIGQPNSPFFLRSEHDRRWCELYRRTRKKTYDMYGTVEGLNLGQSSGIVEAVMGLYGDSIDGIEEINWQVHLNDYISEINRDMPLMWSIMGGDYNGPHTMCVAGYQIWSRTSGWWIFQKKEYINLAEVRDGWTTEQRYFDFKAFVSSGAFVRFAY